MLRTKLSKLMITVMFLGLLQAGIANAANLIVNGDFEADKINNGGHAQNFTNLTGWNIISSSGVNLFNSDFGGGWPAAQHGSQYIDLAMNHSIYQSFTIATAGRYNLTWYGDAANDSSYAYQVEILDKSGSIFTNTFSSLTGHKNSWDYQSWFVNLSPGTYKLEFDRGNAASGDLVLDNVSLSSVPLPAAVWLLGPGLAGLAIIRKKIIK